MSAQRAIRVGDIAWVMRTLDRSRCDPPRDNYLRPTLLRMLESVQSGVAHPHATRLPDLTLVDSAPDDPLRATIPWADFVGRQFVGVHYVGADRRYTNNQNALRALSIGLDTGRPWIVHLEDDLDVCDDFFGSIARWLTDHTWHDPLPADGPSGYPLYTFHAAYAHVRHAVRDGRTSWAYPIRNFYGNQCWAVRRDAAQSIVDVLTPVLPTWSSGQGFDLLLKQWAPQYQPGAEYFLASAPSFVQHVGVESSLHLGRFHQNGSWPGREWTYETNQAAREASGGPR